MREGTKSLREHLEEFKTVGFTLFPKMLDDVWVKAMRDSFEEIGDRLPNPDGSRPQVFVDVLEHKPDLVLSALQNDRRPSCPTRIHHIPAHGTTGPKHKSSTGFSPGHVRRVSSRRHLPKALTLQCPELFAESR